MQAASRYNYAAICGIYFLASIGLGGNIPIDATIALEFMPPSKRYAVALMSMWQPIGVTVASAIAYGTAARWRCDVKLPSCKTVSDGEDCCTVSSNMGWRYMVIIIGAITLAIFFARFFVFRLYESPKFLVSKGKEGQAIEVLKKIAIFNGAPAPTLTIEDFRQIDQEFGLDPDEQATITRDAKSVLKRSVQELGFLKEMFSRKLTTFVFILLGLAYMVRTSNPKLTLSYRLC